MTIELPPSHADLLERPLFAHLATVRPDGNPQSSAMWFAWEHRPARFSHTTTRQKYRNLLTDGRVSFHVQDPDDAYRSLQQRYGFEVPVFDADVRVVMWEGLDEGT